MHKKDVEKTVSKESGCREREESEKNANQKTMKK